MSYKIALQRLASLPENQRMLAASVYVFKGPGAQEDCGCVWGKLLPQHRATLARGENNNTALGELIGNHEILRKEIEEELQMTMGEAFLLQEYNDRYAIPRDYDKYDDDEWYGNKTQVSGLTNNLRNRQMRYARVLMWLKDQIDKETEAALAAQQQSEPEADVSW